MNSAEPIAMVVPTEGIISGQKTAATAIGRTRPTVASMIQRGLLHPLVVPGTGAGQCFRVNELQHHAPDLTLFPIPAKRYFPEVDPPASRRAAVVDDAPPFRGTAGRAVSDPYRQPPPPREVPPAEPEELGDTEIVLTETVMGPDQVMREEIRHLGDMQSAFEFALETPGRYAVKGIDPESGAAIMIREIDTGAGSISGPRLAAVSSYSSQSLQHPGATPTATPQAMLPAPAPPSSSDRMLELLMTFFVKQASDVSNKLNPGQTVTELMQMWREGRESGAEIADEMTGGDSETNIFDVLNTIVEQVGPNFLQILSLGLGQFKGGDDGSAESDGNGHAKTAGRLSGPAA
ncbi:MAG: hypothetical protein ABII76_24745 [Pseudomonadota bacterium]